MDYHEGETYVGVNFAEKGISGEFENCTFQTCHLLEADLSEVKFIDCTFVDCNLSNATLKKTSFQEVAFTQCKLLGLSFDSANGFSFEVRFDHCQLDHASFFQLKLGRSTFTDCQLRGVDFTEANLQRVSVTNCDLTDAVFDNTLMEEADFRGSHHFYIDPELNYIRGAKFSRDAVDGLLGKYQLTLD